MKQNHHIANKETLRRLLLNNSDRITIFFGDVLLGGYTDHGAIVSYAGDGLYSYTVEGHGIGSNNKQAMDLDYTLKRIFSDCQRFKGGDIVTTQIENA